MCLLLGIACRFDFGTSDQIAATDLAAQSNIDTDGGVFYHKAIVGIEQVAALQNYAARQRSNQSSAIGSDFGLV